MESHRKLLRGNQTDELIATIALLRSDAIAPSKLCGVIEYVGSAVDFLPVPLGGGDVECRPLLVEALSTADVAAATHQVELWERSGLRALTILHPDYPSNLQGVFDKPPFIFVSGRWQDQVDSRAVAIVGTRSATVDGTKRAFRLAKMLAKEGITILSGLALGIDTAAHQGALAGKGRTVAVLGTGIRKRYPASNAALADQIVRSGGALISQFYPDQHPTKWTFPVRNRTMSGLALATVVVEAGATSGAKLQAEAALLHGRPVFLPQSLIRSNGWAKAFVEEGFHGARAIEIGSAEDVVSRLELPLEFDAVCV